MSRIIVYLLSGFVLVGLGRIIWDYRKRLPLLARAYRARARVYVEAFGMCALTVTIALLAYRTAPDWLRLGWLSLIGETPTNPVVTPLREAARLPDFVGLGLVGLLYMALLLALPVIVLAEEEYFREGHERLTAMVSQSLKFGLVHALLGIPLVIALVLAVPGFLLALRYRQTCQRVRMAGAPEATARTAGVYASTTLHLLYNFWIVTLFTLALVWTLLR